MKPKILAIAIFFLTALSVFLYPLHNQAGIKPIITTTQTSIKSNASKIEVVFVLDTTGSMGGLIQAAKEKIWSIASTMARAEPTPEIKMGLVAYRDRGDDYVTRVIDLSNDLDSMYAQLMDFQAVGGGDGPESVNQALNDAINKISWSQGQDSYKVVFLLGDAPPHMDYENDVHYPVTLAQAKQKGIVVNAIQCGKDTFTLPVWQQIAQLGNGRYFQVEQSGGAVAVQTPFDKKIAELSAQLDQTRLYYGSTEEKAKKRAKLKATEKLTERSSLSSRARRGVFNSSDSGSKSLLGDGELVEDVAQGRVALSALPATTLPETMKAMTPAEQERFIKEKADKRQALRSEIQALATKRDDFIKQELKSSGSAKDAFDEKVYQAVREQAADKGFEYSSEQASH